MKNPNKILILTAALASAMFATASAQTLSKYAPQGAMLAVELNDLGGVRKNASSFVKEFDRLKLPSVLAEAAKFAVEMGATRQNLKRWVANKQAASGKAKTRRGVTLGGVEQSMLLLGALSQEKSLARVERALLRLAGQTNAA